MKRKFSIILALVLAVSLVVIAAPVAANPGATQVTTNESYERNASIVILSQAMDGSDVGDYVVFYTRAQTVTVRDGNNADLASYDIYYKTYDVSEATWSGATLPTINGTNAHMKRDVAALQDSTGAIWLFSFSGLSASEVYYTTTTNLIGWTDWTRVLTITGRHGDAVVDNSGNILLVVENNQTYYYDGSSWQTRTGFNSNGYMPKAVVDKDGTIVVVSINSGGTDVYVSYSADSGNNWAQAVTFVASDTHGYDPNILQDSLGHWWVFYAPDDADTPDYHQWIEYRHADTISGLSGATAATISPGGYGTTTWWDFWPEPFEDADNIIQLLYTSETDDGQAYDDADIWLKAVGGTGSVSLTAETPEIVAIRVSPTSIDFGTLYPGDTSPVTTLTISNIGTVDVSVGTLILDDEGVEAATGDFFYDNLYLNDPLKARNYSIFSLSVGGFPAEPVAKVVVPSTYPAVGEITGTLIFEATAK